MEQDEIEKIKARMDWYEDNCHALGNDIKTWYDDVISRIKEEVNKRYEEAHVERKALRDYQYVCVCLNIIAIATCAVSLILN